MQPRARLPLALTLAVALVTAPLAAVAHDELTGSDPADGAEGEAPEELTLTFSGAISDVGVAVEVTGPGGSVTDGEPEVDDSEVVQELADELPDGDYAVAWRVTSEDGHPIAGEFEFTVSGGAEGSADAEEAAEAEEPTEESTDEATADEAGEEASDDAEEPAAEDATSEQEPVSTPATGLPGWAWAFIILSAVGLLGALIYTVRRSRT